MTTQLRTDTSAPEHNLRKSSPFAPNPVHFVGCTRFLRTTIVKTYLRPEMCEHPEHGCPLATLAPELARVDKRMKPQIVGELVNYKSRMLPFMTGRRTADKERAFFAIFSAMIGAVEIARLLPDPAMRDKVLGNARDFLLRSF